MIQNNDFKKPGPASSEGEHLIRKFSFSTGEGSTHALGFFRVEFFPLIRDTESLKNAESVTKPPETEKLLLNQFPLSERVAVT